jgi:penicillin amidase
MSTETISAPASPRRRRWPWIIGGIAVVIGLLLATVVSFGNYTVKRSWPQLSGTIEVAGLSGTVDVMRDERGVPTIYADSVDDLMFAQGFVHAQDRFYEMDVRRHITAGRLSEMFGAGQVQTDSFLRTLGWRRVAEQELALLDERSTRILAAYSAGVNAYLADRAPADISLEYSVLGLINPSYTIEPWGPADSVSWLKALAWDLRGNMTDEIYRTIMAASVGIERTEELFPPYPFDTRQPIVLGGDVSGDRFVPDPAATPITAAALAELPAAAVEPLTEVLTASAGLTELMGVSGRGVGSNSWAVSGDLTATGAPLLANDPHLAPAMPSLWYQANLRCRTVTSECDYDVGGWTMAGLPGVFIGHTSTIAWGFTNTGPDVTDLVLHKVEGDSYLVDGDAVPLTTRSEVIEVAGGDPVTITVRETADGPIISGVLDDPDVYSVVGGEAPVPAPGDTADVDPKPTRGDGYAVALRWTALTPSATFDATHKLNTATNFDEFRAAARDLAVPAQNLLYADVNGTIAYQMPGRVPIRKGYDGKWPVPGWNSEFTWDGFIPFEELPYVINPDSGFIVTANQAVIGPEYPYFITDDWAYGARSQRIVDLITQSIDSGERFTVEMMQDMQMDSHNALAAFLVPRIPETGVSNEALSLFDGWNYDQSIDSAPAAYFNAIWRQLVNRMFNAHIDTELTTTNGDDQFWQVVERIWDEPTNAWWDDPTTPEVEDRDAMLQVSIDAAASELSDRQGNNRQDWSWGGLHTLLLQNATLGASGVAPIEALFNRGPIEVAGGTAAVNANGWIPSEGYQVYWVASMRQVVDLANLDRSTWVNLTGNSGHAYAPTYTDQIAAWQSGAQFPWPWSVDAVDQATTDHLVLQPPG